MDKVSDDSKPANALKRGMDEKAKAIISIESMEVQKVDEQKRRSGSKIKFLMTDRRIGRRKNRIIEEKKEEVEKIMIKDKQLCHMKELHDLKHISLVTSSDSTITTECSTGLKQGDSFESKCSKESISKADSEFSECSFSSTNSLEETGDSVSKDSTNKSEETRKDNIKKLEEKTDEIRKELEETRKESSKKSEETESFSLTVSSLADITLQQTIKKKLVLDEIKNRGKLMNLVEKNEEDYLVKEMSWGIEVHSSSQSVEVREPHENEIQITSCLRESREKCRKVRVLPDYLFDLGEQYESLLVSKELNHRRVVFSESFDIRECPSVEAEDKKRLFYTQDEMHRFRQDYYREIDASLDEQWQNKMNLFDSIMESIDRFLCASEPCSYRSAH